MSFFNQHALATLLTLADAGTPVASISQRLCCSPGAVYAVLRAHRPDRRRSPRPATSDLPDKIRGLLSAGIAPARVAFLVGCKRQYVYMVRGNGGGS